MTRLVLVSGPPGGGKSTLTRELVKQFSFTWLEIDCIGEPFSPGDRGEKYQKEIEPHALQCLLNLAALNLKAEQSVILDVPWSHLLLNDELLKQKVLKLAEMERVHFYVLECTVNEALLRTRIAKRGYPQDLPKLKSDDAWRQFLQEMHFLKKIPLPHFTVNTEESPSVCLEKAIQYLQLNKPVTDALESVGPQGLPQP